MKQLISHIHPDNTSERFRHELKYLCSEGELQQIHARIQGLCSPDPHVGADGIYHIRSVYFDDYRNRCFFENENGNDPREKYRIRIYNASDRQITLECKKKERTMTHKDSCPLTVAQYHAIMENRLTEADIHHDLLRKFYALQQEGLHPKVIVAYDRMPFVYDFGNVRITFDRNIGSSTDLSGFFQPHLPLRPILPTGKHVLEVKYDELLPDFLYNAMNLGSLRQTNFSKYYLCRKYSF